jgi:hypothetical protein
MSIIPRLVKVLGALGGLIRVIMRQRRPLVMRSIWRAWRLLLPSAVLLLLLLLLLLGAVPVVCLLASCDIHWRRFVEGDWGRRWRGGQLRLMAVDSPLIR